MSGARDQVGRLLALVPYIQTRGEVFLGQAAADFGVPADQIVKDLNVLWYCGLPGLGMGDLIEVDMDALEGEGMIRVSNVDYLRRPLRLDSAEAAALIVALRALRDAGDDAVRPIVDRALAKLEAAAGDGAALAAQVDVRLPEGEARMAQLRGQLQDAVDAGRQVHLDYYVPARDETTSRVVDPLAVVRAEGHSYLDAWCHLAEGQRLFRLDRISAVDVLDSEAEQHLDVAPRDLSEGLFRGSPDDLEVTLRLEPEARWVAEYYPVEHAEEVAGGRIRVRMRIADPAWLTRLLLRLGGAAQVEAPTHVAETVREAAREALANYEN